MSGLNICESLVVIFRGVVLKLRVTFKGLCILVFRGSKI
jgi:hypothetical protein